MQKYVELLNQIVADPQYQENLDWGQPREGHPEGSIRAHIEELEGNLDALSSLLTDDEQSKLRVLVHTHDTFKPKAKRGVSISHPKSHASLAREFLSRFCHDQELLNIVQFHDEPYAIWKKHKQGGAISDRYLALLRTIQDWDLFLAFLLIDGCTDGKSTEPIEWFFCELDDEIKSKVNLHWLKLLANQMG